MKTEIWDLMWKEILKKEDIKIPHHDNELKILIKYLNPKNKKILDVGCGNGADLAYLNKLGANVYGLDFSEKSIEVCKLTSRRSKTNLNLTQADANYMPYKDESFDLVMSFGLLEHFKNFEKVLKEHCRVLKKDGILLIDIPPRYTIYHLISVIKQRLNKWPQGYERGISIMKLKNFYIKYNLKPIEIYFRGHYPFIEGNKFYNPFSYLSKNLKRKLLKNEFAIQKNIPFMRYCIGLIGRK